MKKLKMMMLNDDNLLLIRDQIELRFRETLEKDGDISIYLYYPQDFLSDFVKAHLDILLMKKTFVEITKEDFNINDFVVYKDKNMTITLEEKNQQVEALEKMIDYFASIEEYEKCAKVKRVLNYIE